jgi:hypothetical protein
MDGAPWLDDAGLVTRPGGARVRGRRLRDHAVPADFTLVLAKGPVTDRPHRRIVCPDFWVPVDRSGITRGRRRPRGSGGGCGESAEHATPWGEHMRRPAR